MMSTSPDSALYPLLFEMSNKFHVKSYRQQLEDCSDLTKQDLKLVSEPLPTAENNVSSPINVISFSQSDCFQVSGVSFRSIVQETHTPSKQATSSKVHFNRSCTHLLIDMRCVSMSNTKSMFGKKNEFLSMEKLCFVILQFHSPSAEVDLLHIDEVMQHFHFQRQTSNDVIAVEDEEGSSDWHKFVIYKKEDSPSLNDSTTNSPSSQYTSNASSTDTSPQLSIDLPQDRLDSTMMDISCDTIDFSSSPLRSLHNVASDVNFASPDLSTVENYTPEYSPDFSFDLDCDDETACDDDNSCTSTTNNNNPSCCSSVCEKRLTDNDSDTRQHNVRKQQSAEEIQSGYDELCDCADTDAVVSLSDVQYVGGLQFIYRETYRQLDSSGKMYCVVTSQPKLTVKRCEDNVVLYCDHRCNQSIPVYTQTNEPDHALSTSKRATHSRDTRAGISEQREQQCSSFAETALLSTDIDCGFDIHCCSPASNQSHTALQQHQIDFHAEQDTYSQGGCGQQDDQYGDMDNRSDGQDILDGNDRQWEQHYTSSNVNSEDYGLSVAADMDCDSVSGDNESRQSTNNSWDRVRHQWKSAGVVDDSEGDWQSVADDLDSDNDCNQPTYSRSRVPEATNECSDDDWQSTTDSDYERQEAWNRRENLIDMREKELAKNPRMNTRGLDMWRRGVIEVEADCITLYPSFDQEEKKRIAAEKLRRQVVLKQVCVNRQLKGRAKRKRELKQRELHCPNCDKTHNGFTKHKKVRTTAKGNENGTKKSANVVSPQQLITAGQSVSDIYQHYNQTSAAVAAPRIYSNEQPNYSLELRLNVLSLSLSEAAIVQSKIQKLLFAKKEQQSKPLVLCVGECHCDHFVLHFLTDHFFHHRHGVVRRASTHSMA